MSQKTKKYLITTEKHEIFIIRNDNQKFQEFCPKCLKDVEMLNVDTAVSLSGIATLEIFKQIRKKKIHFLETASGHLLICRHSLEGFYLKAK